MSRTRHCSSISRWVPAALVLTLAALWCPAPAAETAETASISVGRMMFCRSIKDREPQEPANTFPNTIEKVYCFTAILNAGAETHVVHKWYYQDKLMAEVRLKAKGEYWRTWSSKQMLQEWRGTWRVDVVSADGKILKSASFELVAAEDEAGEDASQERDESQERSEDPEEPAEGVQSG